MARGLHLDIGINGAFLTRRWEEPDSFMRLTREAGYEYHEFCGDVIDPFFSGDREYQMETAAQVKQAAERHGVTITDIYTGVATHRFHGLSHSDARPRDRMKQWILDCMDLALAMGTDRVGGHWDAFSIETLSDPARTEWAFCNIYRTFREFSLAAAEKGIAAIYNEQMYIPSEIPWTLDQAREFLVEANAEEAGVPVYLTVDVGHQAGQNYGLTAPDTDYMAWLERFAAFAEIVHLQQTTPDASHHWPFTPEYNERGHVRVEKVLAAIEGSHRGAADPAVAEVLEPVEQTILIAEIIPGSTKTEERLLEELAESAQYLRQFVPVGGINLSF
jgi:sugar phosphate isomerase/epimerase